MSVRARVLVIEDNAVNLELMREILEGEGYEVREARDAGSGIRIACQERPDLILMDWQLPGMDGLEATRALRSDERTATIPVLAVTAHAMRGDDERAIAAGCSGFVTKPIELRKFVATIARFVRSESP